MSDPGFDVEALGKRADAGDAQAAHRLAVMAGAGINRPFDPLEALRRLRQAADGGLDLARDSLAIIEAEGPLETWLSPPTPHLLAKEPHVFRAERIASPAVCDWLRARAADRLEPAKVFDPQTGEGREDHIRTNTSMAFALEDLDLVLILLREKLARLAGVPAHGLEAPQVLHYQPGQSFDWHVDYFDPANPGHREPLASGGQRVVTALVWLNDDYGGGETAFVHGDLKAKGRKGDALLWANVTPHGAPQPLSRHAGLPPTSGEKWVLSQWMRNRPQMQVV
ncbi:prolyl hydroxylase family protein [Brevundimonas lutea]|uniref:prolyl hydroxylase family protein n=1 Tax=Brevundimonas lutea TaxID=2293980 RepID=UPI000F013757|nr:2OG-Fe(II) oxygenase [Brevundimonas lutea]